tara:strand:+ start:336 stop:1217 length:882 start_codon:yes stop_codon:yes gene_type:complete
MKIVLYATDYSDNAVAALKYAHAISTKIGAGLKVVHVFDYPTMLDNLDLKGEAPFPDIEGDAFKKHHAKLNDFCTEHLKGNLDELNVEIEAIEDKSVVNGIIDKIMQTNALLLVTGMKGGSALRELLMGNTTKHLLDRSPCPVLSIPDDASHLQIDTIVYATDFEDEDIGAIKSLVEIARPFNAEIRALHITTLNENAFKIKREGFKKMLNENVPYEKLSLEVLLSDDIFNTLRIYLGDVGADLVAMLERREKGIKKKWFHRDLVKKMEVFGRVPLVSFNESNYQSVKTIKHN